MKAILRGAARSMIECCALYLLSVMLLLLGVCAAARTPLFGGIGVEADLPLLGITLAYDLALLGVMAYLFAKPERREDGYYVAMAAVALSFDPTFFNNRFYTLDAHYGLSINAVRLGLAFAKVAIMAWTLKVPLSRRMVASIGLTQALVYLGPAPFNLSGLAAGPWWALSLGWLPMALAFLAPVGSELVADPEDEVEVASVRAREFRLVAHWLPFAGVALHLWEMGRLYQHDLSWAAYAPWLLGAAVLVARHVGDEDEDVPEATTPLFLGAALVCSLWAGDLGMTSVLGLELSPLRLTLLAGFLVETYMLQRYGGDGYRLRGVALAAAFGAGATPSAMLAAVAGPYGWTCALAYTSWRLAEDERFETAAGCWLAAAGLACNLATGDPLSRALLHLAGVGVLALSHRYEDELEDWMPALRGGFWMLTVDAALGFHQGRSTPWMLAHAGEVGMIVLGAAFSDRLDYRAALLGGGGGVLVRSPLAAWIVENEAAVGIVGAFATLGAAFWISVHKDELLESLADPQPAAAAAVVGPEGQGEVRAEAIGLELVPSRVQPSTRA